MTPVPRLHVVTDDAVLARPDVLRMATEVLEAGGARLAFHIRGPRTGGRRLHELAVTLRAEASRTGALLVVNDRVDVALAAGVRAVHLGQRSLPAAAVRSIARLDVVGVSCHDVAEVRAARADGASWGFFGHVFESRSHPGREGRGLASLSGAVEEGGATPLLAIGGVSVERVPSCLRAGAWGVAAITGIWSDRSPRSATSEYISVLHAGAGEAA